MLEMTVAAEELEAPATNLEELYLRLSLQTGNTLMVTRPRTNDSYCNFVTGTLAAAQLMDMVDRHGLWITLEHFKEFEVKLSTGFSVLIDGRWKPIHEPTGAKGINP